MFVTINNNFKYHLVDILDEYKMEPNKLNLSVDVDI